MLSMLARRLSPRSRSKSAQPPPPALTLFNAKATDMLAGDASTATSAMLTQIAAYQRAIAVVGDGDHGVVLLSGYIAQTLLSWASDAQTNATVDASCWTRRALVLCNSIFDVRDTCAAVKHHIDWHAVKDVTGYECVLLQESTIELRAKHSRVTVQFCNASSALARAVAQWPDCIAVSSSVPLGSAKEDVTRFLQSCIVPRLRNWLDLTKFLVVCAQSDRARASTKDTLGALINELTVDSLDFVSTLNRQNKLVLR